MTRQYYTTTQVGRIVGVSISTARRWIDSGLLKAIRLPGSNFHRVPRSDLVLPGSNFHRVPRSDLVAFMKRHGMPLEEVDRSLAERRLELAP